jgi:outer membrane protein OmpA-like peptidoglycan-associated protein
MIPCRTIEVRAPVRTLSLALVLLAGLGLGAPAGAAAPDETLLQPTPLILKDGRIANVAVYVVRFPPGNARLDPAMTNRLNALTHEVATDCFLTAQVIGHVDLSEVAGNDTLNAHRLARSRADAVQASLIGGGLPAKAIASVWDWQFMVREARATLWVFRLTPGEDCEGTPLRPGASDLVARAEPDTQPKAAEPSTKAVPSAFVDQNAGAAAAPQPDSKPTARATDGDRPAPGSATVAAAPGRAAAAEAEVPHATQSSPAPSQDKPKTADVAKPKASNQVVAALPETPASAATELKAAAPVQPATADDGDHPLVITFPTNSSYFPPGTETQLRSLFGALGNDHHYRVVLQTSVSGSHKVVGAETPEEAEKYNKWLADRRLDRVREWLGQNVKGTELVIEPEYLANDDSRQIVVRLRPAG